MKNYKRKLIAVALGISMMGISLLGGSNVSHAEEERGVPSQEVESEKNRDEQPLNQEPEKKENSWRYEDGRLIPQVEAFSIHPDAWKKVNGVYLNSQGNPIPGAVSKSIDVSEHQGNIDWEKVKADGINFAILRVGYGDDLASQDDKFWERNVSECERLGIPYGVYLYSYATNVNEARSEANHALRLLRGRKPAYPVYYDLEDKDAAGLSPQVLGQMAKTFNDTVSAAGYKVGVYANLYWWNSKLTDPVFDNPAWSKWVAQYNVTNDYGKPYDMWQSTSSGRVNGINGNVDLNFWMKGLPFTDVDSGSWSYEAVDFLYKEGIMTGVSPTNFGISEMMSRAQFATVLYRMEGSPQADYTSKFPDVLDGQFYSNAVMWASQSGVVAGYENGKFGHSDDITREQMATMLYGYAKYKGLDVSARGNIDGFPDKDKVSVFAREALQWCVATGIISGNGDGTLGPVNATDRAACATMLMRYMTKVAN